MNPKRIGAYTADSDIVDYILGITFELWEEGGIELIRQYYAPDCTVWGLDGITHGAEAVVRGTRGTLDAFPDRKLIAEHVVWSGNRSDGYYTSHRLLSMATNKGPTVYGPATGKQIRMTNIADCVVEDGIITREWLIRDNMLFATQLGADPLEAARNMARDRSEEHQAWLDAEHARVSGNDMRDDADSDASPENDPEQFALRTLVSAWQGDRATFDRMHAPYCVLHRSPFRHYSGRDEVFGYYGSLRKILGDAAISIDHVATQPYASNGVDFAVRWTAAGEHVGEVMGVEPTGKPMFLMCVTHWRCVAGRIASEITVFDDLAVLSQVA